MATSLKRGIGCFDTHFSLLLSNREGYSYVVQAMNRVLGAIKQLPSKAFIYSNFRLFRNGLSPVGQPTRSDWLACGRFLQHAEGGVQFWIGDWLNYSERTWGVAQYAKALETGLDYQTLRDYKWVAAAVDVSLRKDKLSFQHHKCVAGLPREVQASLLERAEAESWSVVELKREKLHLSMKEGRSGTASPDPNFLLGDSITQVKELPDNSVDLLLTDPPYGVEYKSKSEIINSHFGKLEGDDDRAPLILSETLRVVHPKLKDNSHVYIFCSWQIYPAFEAIVSAYFSIKNMLVWEKNNWTAGDTSASYAYIHECIIFAQKGRRPLNGRRDASVLRFDRVPEYAGRVHPTQKPLPLLEYLIEKSTQPGEMVLDPFAGSASTCVAARNKGRKYFGIELSEQWYRVGLERLQQGEEKEKNGVGK